MTRLHANSRAPEVLAGLLKYVYPPKEVMDAWQTCVHVCVRARARVCVRACVRATVSNAKGAVSVPD